jgi:hypothetical protein
MIYVLYNTITNEFLQCGRTERWAQSFFLARDYILDTPMR